MPDTCSMVRISEIHAYSRAAKTYLATLGSSDLDLLPHEIVGCALLVDYRRHCHDAFLLHTTAISLQGSQLSRANSSAHAELVTIDMLTESAVRALRWRTQHGYPPAMGVAAAMAICAGLLIVPLRGNPPTWHGQKFMPAGHAMA
jgi:hypothetical protein